MISGREKGYKLNDFGFIVAHIQIDGHESVEWPL